MINKKTGLPPARRAKSLASNAKKRKQINNPAHSKNDVGKKNTLRIIPLGGNEEVGRNMTIFEYGKDIIILDMGMQFPEEDMPGIDYIIPNIDYLKGKEKNIRGVILSHGHLDHIGAAPLLLSKLNYPLVIGRAMTIAMVRKKMEDFEKGMASSLKAMQIASVEDKFNLGSFKIEFFDVEHSIMDAVGVIIKTPEGTVIHPGDWTVEKNPVNGKTVSYNHLSKLPSPRILMLESLGAIVTNPSRTTEEEMYANIDKLISDSQGKIIIGTFSSQIKRIGHIIEYAEKIGKKVALDGYSMKMNIEIAKELGYIKMHRFLELLPTIIVLLKLIKTIQFYSHLLLFLVMKELFNVLRIIYTENATTSFIMILWMFIPVVTVAQKIFKKCCAKSNRTYFYRFTLIITC